MTTPDPLVRTRIRVEQDVFAVRQLGREVGRLVVATTGKVVGKVLTPEDQQRLAEEANRQLAA